MKEQISWDEFQKVDIRVGTVIGVDLFSEARKPAYKLLIDFGDEIGVKKSSAQITHRYKPEQLKGKQVLAVVNLFPKQVGPFVSECLVTGFMKDETVVLAVPGEIVPNGQPLL